MERLTDIEKLLIVILLLFALLFIMLKTDPFNLDKQTKLNKVDEICLNGVQYYKTYNTLAVKYSQSGKIINCTDGE